MQDLLAVENSRFSSNYDVARDKLLEQLFSRVHHGAFQLISARPSFYASPWSYHVKFLTADTALLSDLQDGLAWSRVIVQHLLKQIGKLCKRDQLISARPSFYASPWSSHVKFLAADTALLSGLQDG